MPTDKLAAPLQQLNPSQGSRRALHRNEVFRRVLRALVAYVKGQSLSRIHDNDDGVMYFKSQRKLMDLPA